MNRSRLSPLLLVAAAPALVSVSAPESLNGVEVAQMTIHERIIIRIPRLAPAPAGAATPLRALPSPPNGPIGKPGPRCVAVGDVAGATIGREGQVDLVVAGGRMLRATLGDDCPTLDFYSGFYVKPTSDGNICARRDAIRSRSGARCAITGFRTLPVRRQP